MMRIVRLLMLGFAVIIFAASVVYAGPMSKKENGRKEKKEQMFKELGLTAEQQQKLEQNRSAQRQEKEKLHESIKAQEIRLHEALKDPAATRASVDPIVSEIKAAQAQLIELRINGIFAVKQILTSEQFAKFEQKMDKKKKEGRWSFQKGPGMREAPEEE